MRFYSPPVRRLDTQFRFYEIKRVFLACPGDLAAERSRFMRLLETVNNLRAHSLGLHLQAVGWERVIPSHGRPQTLINEELQTADLVVVMFWNRIGSPASGNSKETGTIEEFNRARANFERHGIPLVWVYFKKPSAEVDSQLQGVLDFRRRVETGHDIFFREFSTTEEWEEMFREHLVAYLDGLKRWDLEANFVSMRPELAILEGRFLGEGIYEYLKPLEFSIDLDGDGNEEKVLFYHSHGAEQLVLKKFDKSLWFSIPDQLYANPEGREPHFFHFALKDVNNDGFPEILLASNPGVAKLAIAIWGFKKSSDRAFETGAFDLIGVLEGQNCATVLEGGRLRLPYGSIGAAFVYEWSGDHFERRHED
jgi:hypothetical protein